MKYIGLFVGAFAASFWKTLRDTVDMIYAAMCWGIGFTVGVVATAATIANWVQP